MPFTIIYELFRYSYGIALHLDRTYFLAPFSVAIKGYYFLDKWLTTKFGR